MGLGLGLLLAAVSAALFAFAFPPLAWSPLAFVALVPLLVALRRLGLRAALLCLFVFGELFSFLVANALPDAIETYFLQPRLVSWLFAILVWAGTGAIYFLGFGLVLRRLVALPAALQPLATAAAWVAVELVRARLLTDLDWFVSNPWALAGYSQVGFSALMQLASVTGVYGVSFALLAANAALAELWLRRGDATVSRTALLAAGALPTLAALVFGVLELRGADDRATPGVAVAVVQADVDLAARFRPELQGENLDAVSGPHPAGARGGASRRWCSGRRSRSPSTSRRSRSTAARSRACWPKGEPSSWREDRGASRAIRRSTRTACSCSIRRARCAAATTSRCWCPSRSTRRPVASTSCGETSGGCASTRAGRSAGRFRPPPASRAIAVCNEVMLPELVRRRVLDGAEILVSPSNDTWITERNWARLVFQMALVRAIEQRRYLVRASTSGPSAIVDPWGRIQIETEPVSRALIAGTHPSAQRPDRVCAGRRLVRRTMRSGGRARCDRGPAARARLARSRARAGPTPDRGRRAHAALAR